MTRLTSASEHALLALLVVLAGCAATTSRHEPTSIAAVANPSRPLPASVSDSPSDAPTILTAYEVPADTPPKPPVATDEPAPLPSTAGAVASLPALPQPVYRSDDSSDSFVGQAELSVDQLVAEVQARNPSLQAVSAAWRAAANRYPQVVSLDDPMFSYMITPTNGLGMDNGGGWNVQASQKIPWAGKRALRGSAAAAEADAMEGDIGEARLRLSEAARTAFYDYYLARRQMEVNTSAHGILTQFREIASNKYQIGQATEQDVLQTDVEIASLDSRQTELARDERVAAARINTLLHRDADYSLPPPPAKVSLTESLPTAEVLQQTAEESRPDLYALHARIRAEQANLELACKEYYPDVNLVAKYDGFMPQGMRPAVGMDINVPIRYGRRSAAVSEASERVSQRCAEYQDRLDQVQYEVQAALERASQSARVVHLYEERILPAAQRSLDSALANYTSGKLDFLRLLDAERQLFTQREMYYQSIAEYHRRLAELERAVGQPVFTGPS